MLPHFSSIIIFPENLIIDSSRATPKKILDASGKLGIGAQFGGKYLALDIRIIRLPRHGASCPVGMGLSCSADRNIKAKINKDGI